MISLDTLRLTERRRETSHIPASSGDVGSIEQQAFEAINGLPDALEPLAHAIGGVVNLALRVPTTPRSDPQNA